MQILPFVIKRLNFNVGFALVNEARMIRNLHIERRVEFHFAGEVCDDI
jgi:hypothetical protein